ncbi:MAG TPA: EF-P beta-lysylation protein EpmB [Marinobacter sp.]|jgi:EF-P beta-lysylation protein EpmB|nr:EF-P beta-lysylation protein EpmB [Marinobacter sp.]
MIQRTAASIEARNTDTPGESWQQLLAGSVTTPEALLRRVSLDPQQWLAGARAGHALFPIRVPDPYIARIRPGDPADPLLLQVLPLASETDNRTGYRADPLEESGSMLQKGLIRKYRSRALLMVTGQCAINCRYCFRRHFPYQDNRLSPRERRQVLDTLAASPEINEVIFSGGDPLVAGDGLLSEWADALAELPNIRRLRIHTRLPVVIPQRITDELLGWLNRNPLQKIVVLHINHPAELDDPTREAMQRLSSAGVTLLNQSVILRDINDSADTLEALSESLFAAGILPYYLHAFDPVAGAHHYDVSDDRARELVRELNTRLPGFLVPRLVREVPGRGSKTLLAL